MLADEAFEEAVTAYLPDLLQYCRYLTSSKWDAEDLCQETLLKLIQYYGRTDKISFRRALLYKAAKNIWIDHYRKSGRTGGGTVPLEGMIFSESVLDYASIRSLVEWLSEHLTERELRALLLSEVYRYSYQEIADSMACTVSAVRMLLHRSKRLLRERNGAGAGSSTKAQAKTRSSTKFKPPVDVEYFTQQLMYMNAGSNVSRAASFSS